MPLKFENTGIRKVIFNDGVKNTELRKIIYNDVTVWVSYIEPIIDVVGGRAEILVTIKNLNQYDDMLVALSTTKETLMDLVVAKNSSKQFKIKANHGTNSTVRISVHVPDLGGGEYVKYASVKPPYTNGMLDIRSFTARNYKLYVDYNYRGYEPFNDYNFSIDYYVDSGYWNGGTDDMNNWEQDGYGYEGSVTITKESGEFAIPMDDRWYGDMLFLFTIKESGEKVASGRDTTYLPSKPAKVIPTVENKMESVILTLKNPNNYPVSGTIGYDNAMNVIDSMTMQPKETKTITFTRDVRYGLGKFYFRYDINGVHFDDSISCIKYPSVNVFAEETSTNNIIWGITAMSPSFDDNQVRSFGMYVDWDDGAIMEDILTYHQLYELCPGSGRPGVSFNYAIYGKSLLDSGTVYSSIRSVRSGNFTHQIYDKDLIEENK